MAKPQEDEVQWIRRTADDSNASPRISFAAVALLVSVIGGMWVLNQSQLANVTMQIDQLRKDTDARDMRLSAELSRREQELRAANATQDTIREGEVKAIHEELDRRRNEFVGVKEHKEFEQHVNDNIRVLREQLRVLETSRPTTGELQATANALRDRIDKLYGIIEKMEDWIRTRPPPQPAK